MDTTQLVAHYRAGDNAALEALFQRCQPRLYRLALSVLDDPAEADEAAQEALAAALSALDSYRGDSSFDTWLYSITLNACRIRLRKRQAWQRLRQTLQVLFQARGPHPHPEEVIAQRQDRRALWQALQALGEKHRLPVVLRYYHDFSIAEIAQMLNISGGTVASRLHTARQRLLVTLQQQGISLSEVEDERD
jgi:RNA polymerase sigma-70 factor (ECF subfamily)